MSALIVVMSLVELALLAELLTLRAAYKVARAEADTLRSEAHDGAKRAERYERMAREAEKALREINEINSHEGESQ